MKQDSKEIKQPEKKASNGQNTKVPKIVTVAKIAVYSVAGLILAGCIFRTAAWTISGYKDMSKAIKS